MKRHDSFIRSFYIGREPNLWKGQNSFIRGWNHFFLKETGFFYHIFLHLHRTKSLEETCFFYQTCFFLYLPETKSLEGTGFFYQIPLHLKRTKLLEEKEFFLSELFILAENVMFGRDMTLSSDLFYTCREPFVWKRRILLRYLYLQGTKRFRKRQGSFIRYFYTYRDPIIW